MIGNFEIYNNQHFDNRHQTHRHTTINHSRDRHWPTTLKVKSCLHNYGQKEHQNQITINANPRDCNGTSLLPLIHPSTETSPTPPINIGSEKDHLLYFEEIEQFNSQKFERWEPVRKVNQETDEMAPKQTRAVAAKTKELQSGETPLMWRLRNIKNAKV